MPSFFLAYGFFSSETICEANVNSQKRQTGNIVMKLRASYKGIECLHI